MMSYVLNIGMKNPENATIPVGMAVVIIFWGKNHEIGISSARVQGILVFTNIVSSIFDAQNFMSVKCVLLDNYCIPFLNCERKFITVVFMFQ